MDITQAQIAADTIIMEILKQDKYANTAKEEVVSE